MPTLYMLIGIPASGKSTWVASQPFDWSHTRIISTDNIIERKAQEQGKTYSEVYRQEHKNADRQLKLDLAQALRNNESVIWDQTNLTKKVRAKKLTKIPSNYKKIAVYFPTPDDTALKMRLDSRPGKTIPYHVVSSMKQQLQIPTQDEGFDEIIVV